MTKNAKGLIIPNAPMEDQNTADSVTAIDWSADSGGYRDALESLNFGKK